MPTSCSWPWPCMRPGGTCRHHGAADWSVDTESARTPRNARRSPRNPVGLRVGYTHGKTSNQVHSAPTCKLGELWPNVDFTPNMEVGLGDDLPSSPSTAT